jgi:hypothetical protein
MLRSQKGQFIEIIKNDALDRLNKIKEVQKELGSLITDFQEYLEAVK